MSGKNPCKADEPLIEIADATVSRDGRPILENVSLTVRAGENVAILGPNGAGKSSLIKLVTREYYPEAGEGKMPVKVLGNASWNVSELRRLFGIVTPDLQKACDKEITGYETVLSGFFSSIGVYIHQDITEEMRTKAEQTLDLLGITGLAEKTLAKMSPGEARKVLIARALVNDPEALILDEPTAGLDMKASHEFMKTLGKIAASGRNIILITHRINEVLPEIQRVVMIKEGRIFFDGPKKDALTSEKVSALFDIDLTVHELGDFYGIVYG